MKHIGFSLLSQSSFRKVMRMQFPNDAIVKKNFFARCNECISIMNKLKGTSILAELE